MKRALLLIVAIAAFVSAVSAWDIGDARQPPLSQMFFTPQTMRIIQCLKSGWKRSH